MKKKDYRIVIVDSNLILAKTLSIVAKQHYKVDDITILPNSTIKTADEITDFLRGLSDEYRIILNGDSVFKANSYNQTVGGLKFLFPIFHNDNLSEPLILSFSTLNNLRTRVEETYQKLLGERELYHFTQLPVSLKSLEFFE